MIMMVVAGLEIRYLFILSLCLVVLVVLCSSTEQCFIKSCKICILSDSEVQCILIWNEWTPVGDGSIKLEWHDWLFWLITSGWYLVPTKIQELKGRYLRVSLAGPTGWRLMTLSSRTAGTAPHTPPGPDLLLGVSPTQYIYPKYQIKRYPRPTQTLTLDVGKSVREARSNSLGMQQRERERERDTEPQWATTTLPSATITSPKADPCNYKIGACFIPIINCQFL